jgi:hypothetical protein
MMNMVSDFKEKNEEKNGLNRRSFLKKAVILSTTAGVAPGMLTAGTLPDKQSAGNNENHPDGVISSLFQDGITRRTSTILVYRRL